jgi:hypothetical protein
VQHERRRRGVVGPVPIERHADLIGQDDEQLRPEERSHCPENDVSPLLQHERQEASARMSGDAQQPRLAAPTLGAPQLLEKWLICLRLHLGDFA